MSKVTVSIPAPDGPYVSTDFQAGKRLEIEVRNGRTEVPEDEVAAVIRAFPGAVASPGKPSDNARPVNQIDSGPANKLSEPEGV